MKNVGKITAATAALLLVGLALSACSGAQSHPGTKSSSVASSPGDPSASLVSKAQAEGTLTVYTGAPTGVYQALDAAFQKKYNITVQAIPLQDAELTARMTTEMGGGGSSVDVVRTGGGALFEAHPDWFVPLSAHELPALSGYPSYAFAPGKIAVYDSYSAYVVNYNTDLVKPGDVPHKWSDLLKPMWKGKIVLSDPRASSSWLGWADSVQKALGTSYLTKLAGQHFQVISSANPGAQAVAAGSQSLSFPAFATHAAPLAAQGAPIKSATMTDPSILKASYNAISATAPHPAAARLYLNFAQSKEGLAVYCQIDATSLVPVDNVPGCKNNPPHNPSLAKVVWTGSEGDPLLKALGLPLQ